MKKTLFATISTYLFLLSSSPALAQWANRLARSDCTFKPGGGRGAVVTISCLPVLFANAVYWLFILAGTVAAFFIIFGGIKLLTSSGDPGKVDGAKKTITWAVVGLILVMLSFMIVNILADITGVSCIAGFTRFGFQACR